MERREDWPADTLPAGARFLTAGVDVQKDRLEVRVWGCGKRSWLIDTIILLGETNRP